MRSATQSASRRPQTPEVEVGIELGELEEAEQDVAEGRARREVTSTA